MAVKGAPSRHSTGRMRKDTLRFCIEEFDPDGQELIEARHADVRVFLYTLTPHNIAVTTRAQEVQLHSPMSHVCKLS
eukprot:2981902-Amphidinium_carterae.1